MSEITTNTAAASSPFEVLPLDLAKSIGDYLPLTQFRQLHCVSHTLMQIASIGKPFRLRAHECTPIQFHQLLSAPSSHLKRHVGDLTIIALKENEEDREEEEGEEDQEEEDDGDAPPTITCAQLAELTHSIPQLELLECDLDITIDDPTAIESLSFPLHLTHLIIRLHVDPEHERASAQVYGVVGHLFESISGLTKLVYLEIGCQVFQRYPYSSAHHLTDMLRPLSKLAPTLTSLLLSGLLTASYQRRHRQWTEDDIAIFRTFKKLELLGVEGYWTEEQLKWLLAYASEESSSDELVSPFPALRHFEMCSTDVTDEMASLFTHIPTLRSFEPELVQTKNCSWLSKMTQLETVSLICDDEVVEVLSLVAALTHLIQLTDITLKHSALTDADLECIFPPLKKCRRIHLSGLGKLASLVWFTSLPHLLESCHSLTLTWCSTIELSELRRLDEMKKRNEIALDEIMLEGRLKCLTKDQLKAIHANKTEWPQLVTLNTEDDE